MNGKMWCDKGDGWPKCNHSGDREASNQLKNLKDRESFSEEEILSLEGHTIIHNNGDGRILQSMRHT